MQHSLPGSGYERIGAIFRQVKVSSDKKTCIIVKLLCFCFAPKSKSSTFQQRRAKFQNHIDTYLTEQ